MMASFATSTDEKISLTCKALIELIEEEDITKKHNYITVSNDVALMIKIL